MHKTCFLAQGSSQSRWGDGVQRVCEGGSLGMGKLRESTLGMLKIQEGFLEAVTSMLNLSGSQAQGER